MTGPRPTPPRPIAPVSVPGGRGAATGRPSTPVATGGDRRSGSARTSDPRANEPRTSEPTRRPPSSPPSWFEKNAVPLRRAMWIALAVIAVRLIMPRPDGWRRWSDAEAALNDVAAARTSALLYYQSGTRQWPAPGRPGVAPAAMLPYLSGDVSYGRPRYRLTWEYASDTLSGARVIGISVTGDDPLLAQTMAQRAPDGLPFIVSGRRFISLIASSAGK